MQKLTPTGTPCWFIKWSGTTFLLIGGFMAALALTPFNYLFGAIGALLWLMVGFIWVDRAIMILNGISVTLLISAFYNNGGLEIIQRITGV